MPKLVDTSPDSIAEDTGCSFAPLCSSCPLPCSCEDLAPMDQARLWKKLRKGVRKSTIIEWAKSKIPYRLRTTLKRWEEEDAQA